ncbi:MAG TPA: alpha/beta fold hydrolase [Candidatus Polarisedimenticolia bacterium]|jgi:phospholipase/carboxylesterase|nr:alpha/beta fold hydrolase [Candidatus Polarisedimenticolia bacterium]
MSEFLPCVEVASGAPIANAVIWLHGLGADGHDFEPIVPALGLQDLGVRFILPHAPRRPVSVNMGLIMPAWFDIRGLDFEGDVDEKGIKESVDQVGALVARERERGIESRRIVLAGFSQGGAIALYVALRHPEPLAGVVALSTYLPIWPGPDEGAARGGAAREPGAGEGGRPLSVFQAHGTDDPLITLERGEGTRDRLLALGCAVTWTTYPMAHAVCPEEVADISVWLRGRLQTPAPA